MLAQLRDGCAAVLRTIASFENRVLETPPDGNIETPYSFVGDPIKWRGNQPIEYHTAGNMPAPGYVTVYLPIVVVAGGPSLREARDALDGYLALSGANSVVAAFATDNTLGGACDSLENKGVEDYAPFGSNVGVMLILEIVVDAS